MNELVALPENIDQSKAKRLFDEFTSAWEKTPLKDKIGWCTRCVSLFAKVTIRRGKGLLELSKNVINAVSSETYELGKAIQGKRLVGHLIDRKDKTSNSISDAYNSSKTILKNCFTILKDNPKESAPIIFLGVLGFFCGAGTDIGEKTWYDVDGGVPDLDLLGGIGNHRNMFFHSVISAAVLETMVYSSIDASNMIYKNLPSNHDSFWDNLVGYENWANAFVTGACTGIMYHLLIDGTIDGNKAMTNFPFSMSMEGHNAFFITNAVAEGVDLKHKGKH